MYRVFVVKTQANAMRYAIQEDERAKRGVSRVHPCELSNVSRFSGLSPQKRDTFVDFYVFLNGF